MYMTVAEEKAREQHSTQIEKIMLELPPETPETHASYLAGYIDCLFEMGHITGNIRDVLYSEYSS